MLEKTNPQHAARLMAGIPQKNNALLWRLRFSVGDPVAVIETPLASGGTETVLVLRDIEMGRAKKHARVDRVACPADFEPEGGLSGDRETATAQAAAECARRAGISRITADRSLPLIFADAMERAGIEVVCDTLMTINDRRQKEPEEIEHLRASQRVTEACMRMACEMVARAEAGAGGVLLSGGEALTSERVRAAIDHWLLDRGYTNPGSIVACGPIGADCHHFGAGELRTGEPVIVDIFPCNRATGYNGDCTRTVVHGQISETVARMHAAVQAAKAAGVAAVRAGVTGEQVHDVTSAVMLEHGYAMGLPADDSPLDYCAMTHGTGHGIGLDVHEPPLLDKKGPPLLVGDAVTVEPGLYRRDLGGVRLEDIVVVTEDGCENLNELHEGLDWA
ncbi:MAG: M24 family metallopeptidase [Planctomycetota bacterium]|jgi:Xaa-Pro aminopeptidase